MEWSLAFITQIRSYVTVVVFYCADIVNLLPVVHHKNNRREYYDDEQKSFEEVSVLDQRDNSKVIVHL
ncbi:MAG: hypothetical protein ACXWCZ_04545 [Flavisolibacter sp.]